MKVIELFAGVGGFRLGLEKTGHFEVVWGNQWEPAKRAQDAFNCYSKNFSGAGIHSNEDISQVNTEEIPDADLLVGGFPCQDYSVARTLSGEQGLKGKKGVLFWEIKRIIQDKMPKFVLLENVDRLLKSPSSQRGRDFSIMLATFRDLGYSVEWRVLNAAEYGFAQRRRRVFIFASKLETNYGQAIKEKDKSSLLFNEGFFAEEFPVLPLPSEKHKPLEFTLPLDLVEISDTFSAKYLNSGIMIDGKVLSMELLPIQTQPIPLMDILDLMVEEKYYLNQSQIEKFKFLKNAKKIERTSASGHKYIFSEGGMSFPEPLDKPGRTMLTSEGTVNRSTHVVQNPFDEEGRLRFLTPDECEKLNGFPAGWTDTGMAERMRYFCMGNALVVGLIEKMGRKIHEIEKTHSYK
ncbi:DNA (cytosine-5-)-methyltransferase [Metabacillus idriensis]|uniref:DNA (cytosine-5-)-methyltransferase n=1 Tax=Metabacillus idriensis TaxID=324768 RepID=UPI00174A8E7A|nr:DNA (cytosine-5-)-methyltransferase [Metabacillus idriensis]